MPSGVTSLASSASLMPSVPAGRSGTTNQRICALLSQVLISTDGGMSKPELLEHDARLARGARAKGRILVPIRRQTQHRPRIARAQCANDEIVHGRRIDGRAHVLAFGARHALGQIERGDRGRRIVAETLLERGIDPGARHDLGAVERPHLGLEEGQHAVHRLVGDDALLDQTAIPRPSPARRSKSRGWADIETVAAASLGLRLRGRDRARTKGRTATAVAPAINRLRRSTAAHAPAYSPDLSPIDPWFHRS